MFQKNYQNYLLSGNIRSFHPALNGLQILLLSVIISTKVGVWVDVLVLVQSLVHFDAFFQNLFCRWSARGQCYFL